MTREEAIEILKRDNPNNITIRDGYEKLFDDRKEAFGMAIKALEQEPCEDCISRQAAIDAICKACSIDDDYHKCDGYPKTSTWCDELDALRALPSVTPQPKTEKVIKMRDATPEERESIGKYIKSISKPTGVNFWNLDKEPKTGHWIPVSERLPKEPGEYLITWTGILFGEHSTKRTKPLMSIAEYEIYDPENYADWITTMYEFEYYHDIKVLAWMPLPKPYEECI